MTLTKKQKLTKIKHFLKTFNHKRNKQNVKAFIKIFKFIEKIKKKYYPLKYIWSNICKKIQSNLPEELFESIKEVPNLVKKNDKRCCALVWDPDHYRGGKRCSRKRVDNHDFCKNHSKKIIIDLNGKIKGSTPRITKFKNGKFIINDKKNPRKFNGKVISYVVEYSWEVNGRYDKRFITYDVEGNINYDGEYPFFFKDIRLS
jgi:hypothetical protein